MFTVDVQFEERHGAIHANLTVGAALPCARKLLANGGLSSMGMMRAGAGFLVTREEASALGLDTDHALAAHIRPFRNGRDLTETPRGLWLIDVFGLTEEQLRARFPKLYQHLHERVKPERDLNRRQRLREVWWTFGEPRQGLRRAMAGLERFAVTVETAKHRVFQFLPATVLPDHKLVAVAAADAFVLGVLSSGVHAAWALAAGGTLEDRPVYSKSTCFDPFPFPSDDTGLTPDLTTRIRALAEQLDAHRKTQQVAHPSLTLTGMYNVLDKLRTGEALNAKDKLIHTQGLVSVLGSLHDDLDAAVLAAYGWVDLHSSLADHQQAEARTAGVETLLERLVALNARRAAEEAAGHVRWLRPDFQQRGAGVQAGIDVAPDADTPAEPAAPAPAVPKRPWPAGLPEQIKAVADTLAASPVALTLADIEARFTARGRWRERLPTILDTLEALGRARRPQADAARWQAA